MRRMFIQVSFIVMVAALLSGITANSAEARGGYGYGRALDLTPENQAKHDAIMKDFIDRITPIGEKLMAKRMEFEALKENTKAEPKQISKLSEEIASLYTQMTKERLALNERMKKELEIDLPPVRMGGYGGGHRGGYCGYGGGYGGGRRGWGGGRGACCP
jgi:zinc resistance-associated protein